MGFGPIQFGGLASGLDTSSIISAILQIESRPIQLLEEQKSGEEEKLSLLGTLEGLVGALRDKAQALVSENGFYAYALSVGNEGIAAFSLSAGAQSGSHSLDVQSLAQADRYTYDGIADPDASLGSGTITFDYDGQSYTVDVQAGQDTLNGIAAEIEAQAGDAVTASVVNVGTEGSPSYQLVIAGKDTGADYAIQNLAVSGIALTGQTNVTSAQNATVVVDGLTVERSTNVFSDVLEGVSFTVSATGQTTFTVDADPEGVKANVQSFVDAYNEVVAFIEAQNAYDEENGPGGALFGDSMLRTVRGTLQSALFDVDLATVQADSEGYSTLGLVGIDLQADGTLAIDQATLDEKVAQDLDAFAGLFLDEDEGVLVKLDAAIEEMVEDQSVPDPANPPDGEILLEGLFDRRRGTIDSIVDDIDDQIGRLEFRLEKLEESLIRRFANLEEIIGGLNAQGSFLSGGLAFPGSA